MGSLIKSGLLSSVAQAVPSSTSTGNANRITNRNASNVWT
jgi:hypothetical protein